MRISILLSGLVLSACAAAGPPLSAPVSPGFSDAPSNEILIYRAVGPDLAAAGPAILLDGRPIGTCRLAQPILIRVPSGTWTITALDPNGQVSQVVSVAENDRANLRCGPSQQSSTTPAPTLVPVGTEIAREEAGL